MKIVELIRTLEEFKNTYGDDTEVEIGNERCGNLDIEKIGGICGLGASGNNDRKILIYDIYSDLG
jgi:hypothetical protein